jgi:16S rRNA processing protein RimM
VAERICIARIGAAHGTRGEVRLWPFTADPMAIRDYGPLESEDGKTVVEIEAVRPAKDHLVARLRGVQDRNAAERLVNVDLFVARDRLPTTDDDEYYHTDLIGLPARTGDGSEVGTVIAVHDFGAGAILELRLNTGNDTVMLPFTAAVVPVVDIANGRIVIDPPQGSLNTSASEHDPDAP